MLSAGKVRGAIILGVVIHLFVVVLVKVKSVIHYHPLVVFSGGGYRFCPILQLHPGHRKRNPLLFSYLRTRKSSPEVSIINSQKVAPDQVQFCGFYWQWILPFLEVLTAVDFTKRDVLKVRAGKHWPQRPAYKAGWHTKSNKLISLVPA